MFPTNQRHEADAADARRRDPKTLAVPVLAMIIAIVFLSLAVMQLAKGPMPDSPGLSGPTNSSVF